MKTNCPKCSAAYVARSEKAIGHVVHCRQCGDTFQVQPLPERQTTEEDAPACQSDDGARTIASESGAQTTEMHVRVLKPVRARLAGRSRARRQWSSVIAFAATGLMIIVGISMQFLRFDRTVGEGDADTFEQIPEVDRAPASRGSRAADAPPWDLTMLEQAAQLAGHPATRLIFGPNDARPSTMVTSHHVVGVLNEVRRFDGHTAAVLDVSFSPDGRHVVSGSADRTMRLWDVVTGHEIGRFQGHREPVRSVSFGSDGRYLLSASETVRLWDAGSGQELRQFGGGVTSVAVHPDGRRFVTGCSDGQVHVRDLHTGELIRGYSGQRGNVAVSIGARYVLSVGHPSVCVWDLVANNHIQAAIADQGLIQLCAAISADGHQIAIGGARGLHLWSDWDQQPTQSFAGTPRPVRAVAFSPAGTHLLSACEDGTVRLWDMRTGWAVAQSETHDSQVACIAFSPDSRFAVTGGTDGTIRVWKMPVAGARIAQSASGAQMQSKSAPSAVRDAWIAKAKNSVALIEHELGSGTGFIVAPKVVATNAHVVRGCVVEGLRVHFPSVDNQARDVATILHEDVASDLCLLEVETGQSEPLPVAAEHRFQAGEPIVLIGNPGTSHGITLVHASSRGELTAQVRIAGHTFYQLNASVNPGSSGGPVFDEHGQVIAVMALKAHEQAVASIRHAFQRLDDSFRVNYATNPRGTVGIAYGIPAMVLRRALESLRETDDHRTADSMHLAQSLLLRLGFLGGTYLLEIQSNVSPIVRKQAEEARTAIAVTEAQIRRLPPQIQKRSRERLTGMEEDLVELMPAHVATQVQRELTSDALETVRRVYTKDLEEQVRKLRTSDAVDYATKRDVHELWMAVDSAARTARNPPSSYQAYCTRVPALEKRLADMIERLERRLEFESMAAQPETQ